MALSAQAEDRAGTFDITVGVAHLAPSTSSTELAVVSPVSMPVPGSGFTTGSKSTLGFTLHYWFSSALSAELLGGVPRKSNIEGTGALNDPSINPLGYSTALCPTVLLRYHFMDATATWRPSLALGISHASFVRSSVSPQFQAYLSTALSSGATTALPSTASFSSSWNPAFGAGLAYRLGKDWKLDASLTYIPLKTTATILTDLGGGAQATSQGEMKINPTLWAFGITRQF